MPKIIMAATTTTKEATAGATEANPLTAAGAAQEAEAEIVSSSGTASFPGWPKKCAIIAWRVY